MNTDREQLDAKTRNSPLDWVLWEQNFLSSLIIRWSVILAVSGLLAFSKQAQRMNHWTIFLIIVALSLSAGEILSKLNDRNLNYTWMFSRGWTRGIHLARLLVRISWKCFSYSSGLVIGLILLSTLSDLSIFSRNPSFIEMIYHQGSPIFLGTFFGCFFLFALFYLIVYHRHTTAVPDFVRYLNRTHPYLYSFIQAAGILGGIIVAIWLGVTIHGAHGNLPGNWFLWLLPAVPGSIIFLSVWVMGIEYGVFPGPVVQWPNTPDKNRGKQRKNNLFSSRTDLYRSVRPFSSGKSSNLFVKAIFTVKRWVKIFGLIVLTLALLFLLIPAILQEEALSTLFIQGTILGGTLLFSVVLLLKPDEIFVWDPTDNTGRWLYRNGVSLSAQFRILLIIVLFLSLLVVAGTWWIWPSLNSPLLFCALLLSLISGMRISPDVSVQWLGSNSIYGLLYVYIGFQIFPMFIDFESIGELLFSMFKVITPLIIGVATVIYTYNFILTFNEDALQTNLFHSQGEKQ